MAATLQTPIVLSSSSPIGGVRANHDISSRHVSSSPAFEDMPSPSAFLRRTPAHPTSPSMRETNTTSAHWANTNKTQAAPATSKDAEAGGKSNGKTAGKLSKPRKKKQAETATERKEPETGYDLVAEVETGEAVAAGSVVKAGVKRKRPAKTATDATGAPKPRKRVSKAKANELDQGERGSVEEGTTAVAKKPAAKGRRKVVKQSTDKVGSVEVENGAGGEVSHHFGDKSDTVTTKSTGKSKGKGKGKERAPTPIEDLGLDLAPARRRSWTPQMGEELPPSNQQASDESQDTGEGAVAGLGMLEKFGYEDQNSTELAKAKKATTGPTRRKKVEAGDAAVPKRKRAEKKEKTTVPKKPKAPKPPKKPKEPKVKRPKTITDYAISAYRKEPAKSEKEVTDFFQPTATQIVQLENNPVSILEPEHTVKAASKRLTTTVQFQFPEPERAREKMRAQDFLFGTSSQLAKDDSPTTHRMMQQAIKESEDLAFASQARSSDVEQSPTTSRVKVVAAPHGTSLSLGPGESDLWSVAARDQDARMFISTPRARSSVTALDAFAETPSINVQGPKDETLPDEDHDYKSISSQPQLASPQKEAVSRPDLDEVPVQYNVESAEVESQHDSGFVDISDAEKGHAAEANVKRSQVNETTTERPKADTYAEPVLISSSPPLIVSRPALQTLDVNTSIIRPTAPEEEKITANTVMANSKKTKASITPAAVDTPAKRPRGRPRKNSLVEDIDSEKAIEAKKPRGRPRKDADVPLKSANTADTGANTTASTASTAGRRTSPKPNSRIAPLVRSATTPKRQRKSAVPPDSSASRNWHDIDEISDSEPSLPALSPPRRSASSLPSSPRKLDLTPGPVSKSASQPSVSIAAPSMLPLTATTISAVPTEADVQDAKAQEQKVLFKTISRVVKAAPRTRDITRPSWHEKMLMYDPVVLEDLTAWLVGQGVKPDGTVVEESMRDSRVVLEGEVPGADGDKGAEEEKASGRGGKAKGKDKGKGKAKAADKAVEERKKGELQPWMVQKWCETHSICCLWKAGLRGGVRQRY
ncbi:Slx4 endonuclease-like protein [Elsinoe australis]|uniref:Structure-specific endonuclease subunit SLX4 n=1 Tax=Elsinoe australis TaxID=40998 RepID=A0A4U7B3R0_9PEZI|nr:Slx4 endonuclease-like protein [Elsinoe australis]